MTNLEDMPPYEAKTKLDKIERAERDDELVKLLARGLAVPDVIAEMGDLGYNITASQVSTLKRKLRPQVLLYMEKNVVGLMKEIDLAYKPVRVQRVAEILDVLDKGIKECAAEGKWAPVAKLADTLLKGHRYIAEETQDIKKATTAVNYYIQIIESLPENMREDAVRKMMELRALVEAVGVGDKNKPAFEAEKALEAEFSVEEVLQLPQ
jgi:hypothetical protein